MSISRKKVFIDTSGFFALLNKKDLNYNRAIKIWQNFQEHKNKYILYTTEYIISETLTLIQAKINKKTGIKFGEYILKSNY